MSDFFGPGIEAEDGDDRVPFWPEDWSDVPAALSDLMRRTIARAFGVMLLLCAAGLLVAFLTHNPLDPSGDHATGMAPRNLLGAEGALIAQWFLSWFSVLSYLVPTTLVLWGFWLIEGRAQLNLARRASLLPGAIILMAGGMAALPLGSLPGGYGGLAGHLSHFALSQILSAFALGSLANAVALLLGLAGSVLFIWGAGINLVRLPLRGGGGFALPALPQMSLPRLSWPNGLGIFQRKQAPDTEEETSNFEDEADAFDANDEPDSEELNAATGNVRIEPQLNEPKILRQTPKPKVDAKVLPTKVVKEADAYQLPPLSLLAKPKDSGKVMRESDEALEQNARMLEAVLADFGVRGRITHVRPGPVVTLYELEPAAGIRSSRVISLADDIARSMSAVAARVAAIPGRNVIGIELPNQKRETVLLRDLLSTPDHAGSPGSLTLALGKNIGGEAVIGDLSRMPHLLIAGTTGSGKSVAINTMILSLLYRLEPSQCRLIMIDPKMLELSVYDGIPHLLTPVVTDPKKAVVALKWTVREMEDRYRRMSKLGVRNIAGFNERVAKAAAKGETLTRTVQTGFDAASGAPIYENEEISLEPMPFIVVIVDEMADLMLVAGKDIEGAVQRLAQMARAAGIHIIMATQRPSVDVITGTIKANFPTRISFQVTSKIDSRTILGEQGAEQLLGQGDMLYMEGGGRIRRLHGPFVSDAEVQEIVKHLKAQGTPDYLDAITEEPDEPDPALMIEGDGESGDSDDLYDKAVAIVARDRKASTSYVQRRLQIGYNRAARIIERMEEEGVISGPNHSGKREVLVGDHSGRE